MKQRFYEQRSSLEYKIRRGGGGRMKLCLCLLACLRPLIRWIHMCPFLRIFECQIAHPRMCIGKKSRFHCILITTVCHPLSSDMAHQLHVHTHSSPTTLFAYTWYSHGGLITFTIAMPIDNHIRPNVIDNASFDWIPFELISILIEVWCVRVALSPCECFYLFVYLFGFWVAVCKFQPLSISSIYRIIQIDISWVFLFGFFFILSLSIFRLFVSRQFCYGTHICIAHIHWKRTRKYQTEKKTNFLLNPHTITMRNRENNWINWSTINMNV